MNAEIESTYLLPAEWEEQAGVWIAWPHEREDWPGKYTPIPWVYVEIVRLLSEVEKVHILVNHRESAAQALRKLLAGGARMDQVSFHRIPTDRVWTRDSGPMFVADRSEAHPSVRALSWRFNGWAKYQNHLCDERVGGRIARRAGLDVLRPKTELKGRKRRIVLEGGAIDVNGKGALLTTEECLLSQVQQRNSGFQKDDYERMFARWLGATKVVWLNRGIEGDDTHGHVDDIARFVAPSVVVAAVERDASLPNHEPLAENLERLKSSVDQDGNPLQVVEMPMPRPVVFEGQVLPASYANFFIANKRVLVPVFNDIADSEAIQTLSRLFPEREVLGVYARDLVLGLGTLHCLTRDQPLIM